MINQKYVCLLFKLYYYMIKMENENNLTVYTVFPLLLCIWLLLTIILTQKRNLKY